MTLFQRKERSNTTDDTCTAAGECISINITILIINNYWCMVTMESVAVLRKIHHRKMHEVKLYTCVRPNNKSEMLCTHIDFFR